VHTYEDEKLGKFYIWFGSLFDMKFRDPCETPPQQGTQSKYLTRKRKAKQSFAFLEKEPELEFRGFMCLSAGTFVCCSPGVVAFTYMPLLSNIANKLEMY
jgi:hypothetical protein